MKLFYAAILILLSGIASAGAGGSTPGILGGTGDSVVPASTGASGGGSKVKIPDIDIVICLDITGSMRKSLDALKREIVDLSDVVSNMAKSLAIGVVVFGDEDFDRPITTHTLHVINDAASLQQLEAFVDDLSLNEGKGSGKNIDHPEALYSGIRHSIAMPWRASSKKKYILVYTDQVAYAKDEANLFAAVQGFSAQPNHFISTALIGNSSAARAQLKAIARDGKGQFIDSTSDRSFWASFMLAILK